MTSMSFQHHIEPGPPFGGARLKAEHERNGELPRAPRNTGRDYLELWINLARRDWGSLVIIPADRDGSTAEIANALADIGQRLSYGPVTAITVSSLEYGSALALADLQQHVERERRNWGRAAQTVTVAQAASPAPPAAPPAAAHPAAAPASGAAPGEVPPPPPAPPPAAAPANPEVVEPGSGAGEAGRTDALVVVPPARLIISVPPVVTEPLGVAAAEGADAVVLAIRMYRSRMADVRRTVELIGRQRVTGCFLVR